MSNQNDFQYIEAKEFLHLPVIEIGDVKSFIRYATANKLEYIFKIKRGDKTEFFFPLSSIVYKIDGGEFETLADMQQAQNGSFPGATEYYDAKKNKISNYIEFLDFKQSGNYSKEEYDAANKAGFKEGFEEFLKKYDTYKNGMHTSVIPTDIDSPVKLHKYALEKDINNYKDFVKIYDAGFSEMLAYADAESIGFTEAVSYYDAQKKGFREPKEYEKATKLKIVYKKEFDDYRFLEELSQKYNFTFDKMQLLIALSNSENGKDISIAEARKLLDNAQEKFKKPHGSDGQKATPLWYKKSIDREDALVEFLKTNKEVKAFGFYKPDNKSFEIFKASAVKIFVDGSNVAYNDKGGKVQPELKNIRLLVKELNFWKFKNVTVIADATLKHRVKDLDLLEELKKECEYMEAPANTSADEFFIASVKREKCFVVTNDKLNDWKAKDKWVRDHIDNIRVQFTISKEGFVNLKDIDKIREKAVEA